jgi:tripartite-type tricarboxylate transporter receptor subunit TctC
MRKLTKTITAVFATATLLTAASTAWAQQYPNQPIRVIVPYPAGDLADVIARMLGQKMGDELGKPFVIENRPGASGLIGLQAVSQAAPDGYTLAMGQMGSMAVAPIVNKWPIDVRKAFEPVGLAYTNYMMFVTSNQLPVKTLPELIEYSKKNPGMVRAATNGTGGFPHLALELLKQQSGFDFTLIPYKGSSQILGDVIEGRVEMTIFGFSGLYPIVKEGRLNGLAVTGRNRAPTGPEIPTVAETIPGYEALGWFGFFAPQGTPDAVVNTLNKALNNALAMPDIEEQARRLGLDRAPGTPEDFNQTWERDYQKWGGIIRNLGLEGSK